uniref:Large ribosomal subunit protein uL2m n=1 Tax=Karenia brevis TaxID=156230 RepID=A0A0S2QDB7_KARBR|nr:ribosomal protein L2 [Karenia brevis]
MPVLSYVSPRSPGVRHYTRLSFENLSSKAPLKSLTRGLAKTGGRNTRGVITVRGRGGGARKKCRLINTVRNKTKFSSGRLPLKQSLNAKVMSLEYAPHRNTTLALISYEDGQREYIIAPRALKEGSSLSLGPGSSRAIGTTRPMGLLPAGCVLHNVELNAGAGGKIARSAGTFAQLIAKTASHVTLRLPSGEVRLLSKHCQATLGQVCNFIVQNRSLGKSGRKRWLGRRPSVRGLAMNPNDHPHGGGEGRSPIGRKAPVTPWGKIALGLKTRNTRKKSTMYILRSRHSKT